MEEDALRSPPGQARAASDVAWSASGVSLRVKTAIIYHAGDAISGEGLARWLASFSEVVALIEIREPGSRMWKRIRREWRRSGPLRFLDVLAFRAYHRLFHAKRDEAWLGGALRTMRDRYPLPDPAPAVLSVATPNSPEAEALLRQTAPDLVLARCKSLLRKQVFSVPRLGTFVMHPGICPEYRNAHGCFWALAEGDWQNVGMTLLRIDEGIDTGPVFGHYRLAPEAFRDTHTIIQTRVVLDHLEALREKLLSIEAGTAETIDTRGRPTREWGQPWLSAYFRWRWRARGMR